MAATLRKSKKQSAANSTKRRNEALLTFFIDECLGGHVLAAALSAAGAKVERACDHFPPGAADTDWLTVVGAHRWIVLTKDRQIRRRPLELHALINARVRAFVLTAADLTGAEQADVFVKALPKMNRICHASRGPFVCVVSAGGGVVPLVLRVRGRRVHR